MTREELDRILRSKSDVELRLEHLLKDKSSYGYELSLKQFFSRDTYQGDWVINGDQILKEHQLVAIHKHDRFVRFHKHRHDFLEMIYVYSGSIRQEIDGEHVTISQGEILIMDMNVGHSIEAAGENDIAINILMKKDFFDWIFLSQVAYNNIISDFVVRALYEKKQFKQYLHFKTKDNQKIMSMMAAIMMEYYEEQIGMETSIRSYLTLLFNELLRDYHQHMSTGFAEKVDKTITLEIMDYINQHYKDGTIKDMAIAFNFNPDYMGKLIKQTTGKTYKTLIKEKKIQEATYLLKHTKLSIVDIVSHIGYSNTTYFYKQFRELTGVTPDNYRKQKD